MNTTMDSTTQWIIVAKDGSGDYTTIKDAINAVESNSSKRTYIKVKRGFYKENVIVNQDKKNITIQGEGIGVTVISEAKYSDGNDKNEGKENWEKHTYSTATLAIYGDGFLASNLSVENTNSIPAPATALTASGDRIAFYKCSFRGVQDTVYAWHNIQFFKECDIYGRVDFICGDAQAIFQDCNIWAVGLGVVTAQGRDDDNGPTGFVLQKCNVKLDTHSDPSFSSISVTLGRPWGQRALVVVMECFLDSVVNLVGWEAWNVKGQAPKIPTFREYKNTGVGAKTDERKLCEIITEVDEYSVKNFIKGDEWIAQLGVPYY